MAHSYSRRTDLVTAIRRRRLNFALLITCLSALALLLVALHTLRALQQTKVWQYSADVAATSLHETSVLDCLPIVREELAGRTTPKPNACFDRYSGISRLNEGTFRIEQSGRLIHTEIELPVRFVQLDMETRVAHVSLRTFDSRTLPELFSLLFTLYRNGVAGVVLDLRGNRGGSFNVAVAATYLFGGELDRPLLTTQFRDAHLVHTFRDLNLDLSGDRCAETVERADGTQMCVPFHLPGAWRDVLPFGLLQQFPVALIVDRKTASAAEVFSGVLQLLGHPVVGEQTHGKGFMQTHLLKAETNLRVTTSELFIGEGRQVQGVGITPDYEVRDDPSTKTDEVLGRARAVLAAER